MANTWDCELTLILRGLINDLVVPYTYNDSKLQTLLVISAQLINQDFDFDTTYTINVEQQTISPDPISDRDDIFINLTCLKAACLVLAAEVKESTSQAFKVVDGPSQIDFSNGYRAKQDLYKMFLDDYAQAKIEYKIGNLNNIKAILTPYTVERISGHIYFG
jgi:hypothetical protein